MKGGATQNKHTKSKQSKTAIKRFFEFFNPDAGIDSVFL